MAPTGSGYLKRADLAFRLQIFSCPPPAFVVGPLVCPRVQLLQVDRLDAQIAEALLRVRTDVPGGNYPSSGTRLSRATAGLGGTLVATYRRWSRCRRSASPSASRSLQPGRLYAQAVSKTLQPRCTARSSAASDSWAWSEIPSSRPCPTCRSQSRQPANPFEETRECACVEADLTPDPDHTWPPAFRRPWRSCRPGERRSPFPAATLRL